MIRKLPNYTNTPPGGWKFKVPETGKVIGPFNNRQQLAEQVAFYYRTVGYEMPPNVLDLAEQQICAEYPEACGEAPKDAPPASEGSLRHTFHAAIQCISTLTSNRAGSGERPSLELQEKRAQVCVACPQNTDITPCSVCSFRSLENLIKKLVGAKPTTVDKQLKFCGICHCSNAAKVATKHEAIWNHMPQSQKDRLPIAGVNGAPVTCWLVSENTP